MKYVTAGTAGHIDHGKSALVRALTGTDPDRLEEEKRRGITIDLGFAHLDLGKELRVAFVDVPGHERFVKNMLAGAGGIDLVILVVAADESIKPQTREHFDICRLLGVRQGLIAITKSDLVEPEITELVRLEIQDLAAGSFLEGAPCVSVSSKTGAGLDRLKAEILRLGLETAARSSTLPFRLPIDRAFVMKGFGTVVTGTLAAGSIQKEDDAELYPTGQKVRIRGIEVHNQPSERATAGERTALNLASVEAKEIRRGMVLAPPGAFQPTVRIDAALDLLPAARALKDRSAVHFHSGTMETLAEIGLLEGKTLPPGSRAYAQFRLRQPALLVPGDRFIIRQFSPVTTIGGGVILDGLAPRRRARDEDAREFLRALEFGDAESRLETFTREAGEAAVGSFAARLGWSQPETLATAKRVEARGELKLLGQPPSVIVNSLHFDRAASRLLAALEQFQVANPLLEGMPAEALRSRPASDQSDASQLLFAALVGELEAQGKIEARGEIVRLAGRGVQLAPEEAAASQRIAEAFRAAGLAVPGPSEVLEGLQIDRARAEKLLQLLLRQKVLARVSAHLVFHQSALDGLRALMTRQKASNPRLSVATFKELTGLTRKYAIPLLEYLDRERVTRRDGEERIIL